MCKGLCHLTECDLFLFLSKVPKRVKRRYVEANQQGKYKGKRGNVISNTLQSVTRNQYFNSGYKG